MSRKPEPGRKAELIPQILDFLLDKPLSSLTFRTLASALGVSTFTLVYQFGTRAELISDIVSAITSRQSDMLARQGPGPETLDEYYENLRTSWRWTLSPRNRQLQRLEFEASMLEVLEPDDHNYIRTVYATWVSVGRVSLEAFGLSPEDAALESRIMVDAFYGLQYDLIVNGDEEEATASFMRLIEHHRRAVEALATRRVLPASTSV